MKASNWVCSAAIAILPLLGCGGGADSGSAVSSEVEFDCPSTSAVATVTNLNYPSDCESAGSDAASNLDSGHYRRACEEAAPEIGKPPVVTAAHVTQCTPTEDRGVFVDVEICCPDEAASRAEAANVFTAAGPECPDWRTRALATHLHYPDAASCEAVIPGAEKGLRTAHYRKACAQAVPRATRSIEVLDARVVECRSGGGTPGVVVNVELCCDGKVFSESEFRELVWKRPIEEVRAALGEPLQVTEWPRGTHWSYPFEVARDDQVFPEVTVVVVDDHVESYYF